MSVTRTLLPPDRDYPEPMIMPKDKKKKEGPAPFIEVVGGDTHSAAAKASMDLILHKLKKMKEDEKKAEKYGDML